MENIPQVPGNPAKAAQTHDARKAVSATLSVLKWTGAIFRPRKLDTERALLSPLSILLKTKAIRS